MSRAFLYTVFFAIFGTVITVQADDPTGWKDVPWGSSPADIEEIEDIIALEEKDHENRYFRGERLRWKHELKEYKVAGIPFWVQFFFDLDDRFSAYTLTWKGDEDHAEDAFEELVRLLEERYQRTTSVSDTEVRFGNNFLVRCELGDVVSGDREIKITYLDPNDDQVDRL